MTQSSGEGQASHTLMILCSVGGVSKRIDYVCLL